ncbi:hypothetical protein F441_19285 [Phytophthora nicotianae CJ01A1]|uniref:SWIM-type domain-containing protein n=1 Tax=Phytophthora nicotianae CJ01A1 TaxID=1317063 RepID=W2VZU6_PHYNI|nr:hypothetical protein F441_19285 [Phytophthora nicotianae CJ01A1]
MWVMAHRVDLPHFNNHTNNRVESLFSKLKRTRKGKLTMRTSFEALFAYQKRLEEDYRSKVSMPGTLRDVAYTEEMNIALGMTTRWVAQAIKTQYDAAVNDNLASAYAFKDNGSTGTVTHENHEFLIEKDGWTCDCEFSQTMKLSCCHVMAFRKACGNPFIIFYAAIESGWFGQSRCSPDELSEVSDPFVAKIFKSKLNATPGNAGLSEPQKYRQAQQAFVRIGDELARLEDGEFVCAVQQLDQWWYNLRQGKRLKGARASSEDEVDKETENCNGGVGAKNANECSDLEAPTQKATEGPPFSSVGRLKGGIAMATFVPAVRLTEKSGKLAAQN